MNQTILLRADSPHADHHMLDGLFRLRHRVFHENLQWDVRSVDGQERDHYDDLNPVYPVSRNREGNVTGTMRLLPTTGPYMLIDVFPQLLRGEQAPRDKRIWEISRFAVISGNKRDKSQASLNADTFQLMRTAAEFALQSGVAEYVFVTSVAVERLLKKLGLPVERFGDAKAQRVGKVLSVACRLPVDGRTCRALHLPILHRKKEAA